MVFPHLNKALTKYVTITSKQFASIYFELHIRFDFDHSLGNLCYFLHQNLLICYHCSYFVHTLRLVTLLEQKLLLITLGKTRNSPQIVFIDLTFWLAGVFDFALSLGVTTWIITTVVSTEWNDILGGVDFDILKSWKFENLVYLLSSLRWFDRVYQGCFV